MGKPVVGEVVVQLFPQTNLRGRLVVDSFVRPNRLIISKLWWAKDSHSEQQLRDVNNLVATGCDTACIARWTRELGLLNLWLECNP